ncbi:CsgG/HfaB family protein [Leptospira adleri]|uniref:CsgG/HfaB family protein n=1 Tax=Leptospira adleri TaxID=2023186 RepID=UPI0014386890|nr:CsgG/HfaB family protein [Leptospira adleri]
MEQIKKQFDYTNEITEAEKERGILRVSDRYNNEIKKTELRTKEILSKLENKIINRMNALLLSKKLIPLERSEIVKLLKESSLYQTGLFDNEKNIQIGKLATADLIMLSKIEVKVSGAYVRNYEVTLTGKLVSVKDGRILAIGEVFVEDETLDEKLINQVVDKWFENIPDGSKLFLLF